MKQEDKELLLRDLAARLPYGVKIRCNEDIIMTLRQIDKDCFCECWENEDFICHSRWMLPYLRPMSSMTEEELSEYRANCRYHNIKGTIVYEDTYKSFDWLNSHHLDYRGLIEKGLALEAPEGMYKKEE